MSSIVLKNDVYLTDLSENQKKILLVNQLGSSIINYKFSEKYSYEHLER